MTTFMHVAIEQHASPKQVMRTEGSIACESRRTRGQSGSRMDLTSILRILANAKVQSILYYHTSDPSNRLLFAEAAMADARTTPMEFLSSTSPPTANVVLIEALKARGDRIVIPVIMTGEQGAGKSEMVTKLSKLTGRNSVFPSANGFGHTTIGCFASLEPLSDDSDLLLIDSEGTLKNTAGEDIQLLQLLVQAFGDVANHLHCVKDAIHRPQLEELEAMAAMHGSDRDPPAAARAAGGHAASAAAAGDSGSKLRLKVVLRTNREGAGLEEAEAKLKTWFRDGGVMVFPECRGNP